MVRKLRRVLTIFLCVFCFGVMRVEAAPIDLTRESSLTCQYQYDNILLRNTGISIYSVATVDEDGNYTLKDELKNSGVSLDMGNASLWQEASEELYHYIEKNGISYLNKLMTDQEGKVTFSDLTPGLYLIVTDGKELGDYIYSSSPSLVSIPLLDDMSNEYIYDVSVNIKTEVSEKPDDVTPPNTMDYYFIDALLFLIFLIVSIVLISYILKMKEKGKEK